MIPSDKRLERLITVAELYYEKNCTQNEIAKQMGISRPLVSVLLNEARSMGVVSITINRMQDAAQLMAKQLETAFGLEKVLVVKTEQAAQVNRQLAQVAYEYCFSAQHRTRNVGIGWGSIIGSMAEHAETLPDGGQLKGRVVPLVGGIGATYRSYHINELVRVFASKTGLAAEYLYMPAFFDSEREKALSAQMENYRSAEAMWDSMDRAIINISNFPSYPDFGVEYRFGGLLTQKKAVGRVLAHYYDKEGALILPVVDNAMQASIEQLHGTGNVTALASSLLQPACVIGALRLGIITSLILPDVLAERVLNELKK